MARPGLDKNVKFKAMVLALKLPRPYVRGLLETMWDVANENGIPTLGTADLVEAAAEWPGTPGAFFTAVKDLHLIDEMADGRWQIHDYWHHAPEYVKGRLRKEQERLRQRDDVAGQSRDSHATVTKTADTPSPSPSPLSFSAKAEKKERHKIPDPEKEARKEVLEALARVTELDCQTSGAHLGRVVKVLRAADPPYTAAEVLALPTILSARKFTLPLTPGTVQNYIGYVRKLPTKAAAEKAAVADREARLQAQRDRTARDMAEALPPNTTKKPLREGVK